MPNTGPKRKILPKQKEHSHVFLFVKRFFLFLVRVVEGWGGFVKGSDVKKSSLDLRPNLPLKQRRVKLSCFRKEKTCTTDNWANRWLKFHQRY